MKQSLELRQSQRLTITPQLQQAIRILQLTSIELVGELSDAQENNPMLDVNDSTAESRTHQEDSGVSEEKAAHELNEQNAELDQDSVVKSEDLDDNYWQSAQLYASSPPKNLSSDFDNDIDIWQHQQNNETLQKILLEQLQQANMSKRDKMIAEVLIQFVDDRGYLRLSLDEILESVEPDEEVDLEEIEMVLHQVQNFEPTGVAARTPGECLLLQLRTYDAADQVVQLARKIADTCLPLLAKRDYNGMCRSLNTDEQLLREAIKLIRKLNPHPGYSVGNADIEYVVPDVVVKRVGGKWRVAINPNAVPRLVINQDYQSLIKENSRNSEYRQMKEQLHNAKMLLNSLKKRHETILAVASEIIKRQQVFFDKGPEAIIPMVLKDIAKVLGVHESTVSRATVGKYMLTPVGIYELKYFFSSQLQTSDGGATSSLAIQSMIKKMIDNESGKKPISDNIIRTLLNRQGIKVARRTVAKYRELMNIPSSSRRKSL